jgi:hypothetical protein
MSAAGVQTPESEKPNVADRIVDAPGTLVGLAIVGAATPVRAQSVDHVATAPPNVVLSNYDNVPVGPFGGLEGSAYVARVGRSICGVVQSGWPLAPDWRPDQRQRRRLPMDCRLAAGAPEQRRSASTAADAPPASFVASDGNPSVLNVRSARHSSSGLSFNPQPIVNDAT